jgi:hypothetical protein
MIKIRSGHTRIVFILLNLLVIKIPNPRFDKQKNNFVYRKSFLGFLKRSILNFYIYFLYGLIANISEALVYSWNKQEESDFLVPVFSIGICNFQIYQGEEEPSKELLWHLYNSLSDETKKWLYESDTHEISNHNWRKTPEGLKMIDYALDPMGTSFAVFIARARREIPHITARE